MAMDSMEQVGRVVGTRRWGARRRSALVALAALLACSGATASAREAADARIDLNRASVEELMSLPGVGAAKAQAIVDHRRTAPFRKVEELLQVKGIGDSIYATLRDRITVSAPAEPGAAAGEAEQDSGD